MAGRYETTGQMRICRHRAVVAETETQFDHRTSLGHVQSVKAFLVVRPRRSKVQKNPHLERNPNKRGLRAVKAWGSAPTPMLGSDLAGRFWKAQPDSIRALSSLTPDTAVLAVVAVAGHRGMQQTVTTRRPGWTWRCCSWPDWRVRTASSRDDRRWS